MDYSFCQLIGKEKAIFNMFSEVHSRKTDVYSRKRNGVAGLTKGHLRGFKTSTSQVSLLRGPLCRVSGLGDDRDG